MSLSFLSKKTWNPTNLKNVEKVWMAEQRADAEAKKLHELKKQIAEERQLQELKELQVSAGLVDKNQLEKLDWMYEGPMATMQDHQQNTESYLLGKEVDVKEQDSEINKVESQPGMLFLNSVSAKNDMFSRLHEDPLLMIKQNELKKREDVVKNPVKMARIKQQLEAEIRAKKEKKKMKKEAKKERKKEKKRLKEEKEAGDIGDTKISFDEDDADRRRSEKRRSEDKAENGGRKRMRVRSRSSEPRDRRCSRDIRDARSGDRGGRDRYSQQERSRSRGAEEVSRKRYGGGRGNRSPMPPRRRQHDSRNRSRTPTKRRTDASSQPSHDGQRGRREEIREGKNPDAKDQADDSGSQQEKRYGLQNGREKTTSGMHLGPDPALLEAKEKEKREQEKAKMMAKRKTMLSQEEKKRRLAEMQQDGVFNEEKRKQRVEHGIEKEQVEDAKDALLRVEREQGQDADAKPAFLLEMGAQVYMGGEESLEDRIQKNLNTRQRRIDEAGFL